MAVVPSIFSKNAGSYDADTIDLKPTVEANEQIKVIFELLLISGSLFT